MSSEIPGGLGVHLEMVGEGAQWGIGCLFHDVTSCDVISRSKDIWGEESSEVFSEKGLPTISKLYPSKKLPGKIPH